MKKSILVVDDEWRTREMLRMFLEMEGYEVFEAEDGVDAIEKAGLLHPDVMILDVMMPRMDGITACKQLRSTQETAKLPIIMLSGKIQEQAIREGLEAGATTYMTKPMSHKELLGNIRAAISGDPVVVLL
jgi:DNA-binding response OmpR family regulator